MIDIGSGSPRTVAVSRVSRLGALEDFSSGYDVLEDDAMPPWTGRNYRPAAPALAPSPRGVISTDDDQCYPTDTRLYANKRDFWCDPPPNIRTVRVGFGDLDHCVNLPRDKPYMVGDRVIVLLKAKLYRGTVTNNETRYRVGVKLDADYDGAPVWVRYNRVRPYGLTGLSGHAYPPGFPPKIAVTPDDLIFRKRVDPNYAGWPKRSRNESYPLDEFGHGPWLVTQSPSTSWLLQPYPQTYRRQTGVMDSLEASGPTVADLLKQMNEFHRRAPGYKNMISKLLKDKALTSKTYSDYRVWIGSGVKMRQDLTQLMRGNPRLTGEIAKAMDADPGTAISRVENMSITNIVLSPGTKLGGLEGFGILPAILLGPALPWLIGAAVVTFGGTIALSSAFGQDLKIAQENTRRLDLGIKAALDVTKSLSPEARIDALRKMQAGAKDTYSPPGEGFIDKLKSAIAQPLGIAAAIGLVYVGGRYVMKRRKTP
jgi:hypothetical protein